MQEIAFWVFIGLFLVVVIFSGSREKIEKQRTLQRLLERGEPIDEELVNRLLARPGILRRGGVYRALRAVGAFIMVTSVPVGVIVGAIRISEGASMIVASRFGTFMAFMICSLGLGLFVAARFCEKPDQGGGDA